MRWFPEEAIAIRREAGHTPVISLASKTLNEVRTTYYLPSLGIIRMVKGLWWMTKTQCQSCSLVAIHAIWHEVAGGRQAQRCFATLGPQKEQASRSRVRDAIAGSFRSWKGFAGSWLQNTYGDSGLTLAGPDQRVPAA